MHRRRGNNDGSIGHRPDGRWEARLSLSNGQRKSFYGATRRAVQVRLTAALAELAKGRRPVANERLTLGAFLESWLRDKVAPTVRPATARGYESKLRIHIIPSLGRTPLAKLTPQQIHAFLREKQKSGLSPQTVSHLRAILRAALNDAVAWEQASRNVAALVDGPHVPQAIVDVMTPEEARAFLDSTREHRLSALFSVALAIGLRQGEALGLRWTDIDLDNGVLTVNAALQRVAGAFRLVEPKTRHSRRSIALPAVALTALRAHRARQLEERLAAGPLWEDWGLVFTSATGHPLHGPNVTIAFQQLLKRAGLRRMTFHSLRHCCASLLLAQGLSPRLVMELLGHSNIALTMNTYSHVLGALQREAAVQMDVILGAR